jgi:hypothetical protein
MSLRIYAWYLEIAVQIKKVHANAAWQSYITQKQCGQLLGLGLYTK